MSSEDEAPQPDKLDKILTEIAKIKNQQEKIEKNDIFLTNAIDRMTS